MRIIDAFWEKQNLGVTAVEFIIEPDDTSEIMPQILCAEKQYNVVKTPVDKPGLVALVQENGYRFIECMSNMAHDLSKTQLETIKALRIPAASAVLMDDRDIEELFREIDKGIFDTNRIYFDPRFQAELSAKRYINWLKNDLNKDASLYKVVFRGKTVGFFILRILPDYFNPYLIGLYDGCKGLGLTLSICVLNKCVSLGAKQVVGDVSTNNLAMIRVNSFLGYNIRNYEYVFVKHNAL